VFFFFSTQQETEMNREDRRRRNQDRIKIIGQTGNGKREKLRK
jgi:hypothetical protein